MINWALVKSPLNWFTVILMLIIAGFAVDVLVTAYQKKIAAAAASNTSGVSTES